MLSCQLIRVCVVVAPSTRCTAGRCNCFSYSVVATKTFKIPLSVVQFAFLKMEHARDVDEIECLLANLIFRVSPCLRSSVDTVCGHAYMWPRTRPSEIKRVF